VLAQFLKRSDPAAVVNGRDTQNVAGFGLTHLYTSLMVRAVATADIIAGVLGLLPVAWVDVHEGGGIYIDDEETGRPIGQAGNNRAYFETHYPRLVLPESLAEAGWWNRPVEEQEQRPVRARRFLNDLIGRHGGTEDRVAVISHGGFYNDVLAALLDWRLRDGYWFVLNNAAITRIDFTADGIGMVYLNRADFLPRNLIT
jgi:2,3-bisphosphoglycerate-dependent phosphoglycerate mutase